MRQLDNAALAAEYNEALNKLKLNFSRVAAILAMVFVPSGAVLDYFTYPDRLGEFFLLRCGTSVVILIASIAYYRPGAERYSGLVTFGWFQCIQVMIAFMIYQTDGATSPYYAGLTLTMFAAAMVLPLSFNEILGMCLGTISLYLVACIAHGTGLENPEFGANLFFVVVTCVIAATAVFYNERRRVKEFVLGRDLGAKYRELTELDRLKDLFVANISHELRTPLTVILAPAQELLSRAAELPAWATERLGIVKQNAERLLTQVNDLLDVLKLEADRMQLVLRPLDVAPLLRQQLNSMIPWADSRGVELRDELGDEALIILGDTDAIIKISQNLLSNAIKFSEPGDAVTLSANVEGDGLQLQVADTGIGIPADQLTAIFDRFHQVDQSTTRKHKGSGIGLALAKELTEAMDGNISVSSIEGRGTIMQLRFPLLLDDPTAAPAVSNRHVDEAIAPAARVDVVQANAAPARPSPSPVGVAPAAEDGSGQPTLLVVEDEAAIRDYLASLFSDRFHVVTAADGRSGLTLARDLQPELMLLDFMLPELDGLEVCRALKLGDERSNTKVLMLTARTDEEVKLQALDYGADDFLTKPFSPAEVRTRVRNLLETHQLEQALRDRNNNLSDTLANLQQTQQQLLQSEKLNALGQLSAGLLHEVNNPLNYTMTALSLAKTLPGVANDEMLADIVADIDEGMQRIGTIVSDLRAFAYPDDASKHMPFNVRSAIEKALRFTAHDSRDFTVNLDVDPELQALGSESHVVQVLVNLFGNACRAMAEAGTDAGRIDITAAAQGTRVVVAVADNGPGMEADIREQCLNPFFTTRDVGSGMGMGLSICSTIVSEHGGHLQVDSAVGEGTTMRFDLAAENQRVTVRAGS